MNFIFKLKKSVSLGVECKTLLEGAVPSFSPSTRKEKPTQKLPVHRKTLLWQQELLKGVKLK